MRALFVIFLIFILAACSSRRTAEDAYKEGKYLESIDLIALDMEEKGQAKLEVDDLSRFSQMVSNVMAFYESQLLSHLANKDNQHFNIKVDEGGIGDIEFISQYLVLNYAHKQPKMTTWSDNVRILELAAKYGIMSTDEAETLTQIYINMRNEIHRLALQLLPSTVDRQLFELERERVNKSWQKWLIN